MCTCSAWVSTSSRVVAAGIETRRTGPRGRVELSDRHIVQLRDDGWTYAAIGRLIGLSHTAVRGRYLKQRR